MAVVLDLGQERIADPRGLPERGVSGSTRCRVDLRCRIGLAVLLRPRRTRPVARRARLARRHDSQPRTLQPVSPSRAGERAAPSGAGGDERPWAGSTTSRSTAAAGEPVRAGPQRWGSPAGRLGSSIWSCERHRVPLLRERSLRDGGTADLHDDRHDPAAGGGPSRAVTDWRGWLAMSRRSGINSRTRALQGAVVVTRPTHGGDAGSRRWSRLATAASSTGRHSARVSPVRASSPSSSPPPSRPRERRASPRRRCSTTSRSN